MSLIDHSVPRELKYKRLCLLQAALILLCVPLGRKAQLLIAKLVSDYPSHLAVAAGLGGAICLSLFIKAALRAAPSAKTLLPSCIVAVLIFCFCASFIVEPIEWTHLLLYGALSYTAFNWFDRSGLKFKSQLHALLLAIGVSLLDEGFQAVHPQRVFDLRDLVLNLCGAILGLAAASCLSAQKFTRTE